MTAPIPRLAPSLVKLRAQINVQYPDRSKASDGWIGDAAHAATKSDHNPDEHGIVWAIDITHDPRNGVDARSLAENLRMGRDERISYVISNKQMYSSYPAHGIAPWTWRPYSGANPHTRHVHISARDVEANWRLFVPYP